MQSRERTDSELAEHVKKAVNPVEAAPKAKHVRAIIVYSWEYQTTKPVWHALKMQPVLTDQVQGYKCLVLLHKLMVGGPPAALEECLSGQCLSFLETCLTNLGGNNLGLGYGPLIRAYIRYLRNKLQFHSQHSEFSGNFDYEDCVSLECVSNSDRGYYNFIDLQNFSQAQLEFGNSVLEQLGTYLSSGSAGGGECRASALVPLLEESAGVYKYLTSILTALHLCTAETDGLQPLVQNYQRLFNQIAEFYRKCQANNLLKGLVCIPEMPSNPPEFSTGNEKKNQPSQLQLQEEPGKRINLYEEHIYPVLIGENEEEASATATIKDEEAVEALAAMHEKYIQVKRQLMNTQKLHSIALEKERKEKNELVEKYESMCRLYNELRDRFVAQVKSSSTQLQQVEEENKSLKELLITKADQENDPFEELSNASDDEMQNVLMAILQVSERLEKLQIRGSIPELAVALANLINRAIQVQAIIKQTNESNSERRYRNNPQWSKGLISAAWSIATSIELLAEQRINSEAEKMQASALQVNSGVVHLVSAARVKVPSDCPEMEALLEAAGSVAFIVKQITQREDSTFSPLQSSLPLLEVDDNKLNETEQKIEEINLQVEVLKREKELQSARQELGKLRKNNYSQPNQ